MHYEGIYVSVLVLQGHNSTNELSSMLLPQLPQEGRDRALSATSYITDAMEGKTAAQQQQQTNTDHKRASDEKRALKTLHMHTKSTFSLFLRGACEARRSVSICSRLISSPEMSLAVVIQWKGVTLPLMLQTGTSPGRHKKTDSSLSVSANK